MSQQDYRLDYILNMRHHSDHTGANLQLKAYTDCRSIVPDGQSVKPVITLQTLNELRADNRLTVTSTIAKELATNPFFHSDNPGLQQTLYMRGNTLLDVFTRTRSLTDRF